MPKFKVGDKVRVNDGSEVYESVIETIDPYDPLNPYYVSYNGLGGWYPEDDLSLREDTPKVENKFKVGDKVSISGYDNYFEGMIGTIITVDNPKNGPYIYEVDCGTGNYDGCPDWFKERELTLIEKEKTMFKVGDEVYVNFKGYDYPGVIKRINDENGFIGYLVEYTLGDKWFQPNEVKSINDNIKDVVSYTVGNNIYQFEQDAIDAAKKMAKENPGFIVRILKTVDYMTVVVPENPDPIITRL